jgi:hypothetical protein
VQRLITGLPGLSADTGRFLLLARGLGALT